MQRRQDHQHREEFLDHLLHDGNSCGTGDKSDKMNITLVDPAVTEALLHGTHGIFGNSPCSTPQTVLSTTREINVVAKGGPCRPPVRRRAARFTETPAVRWLRVKDVGCRLVQGPVYVDVESDFNLRQFHHRGNDTIGNSEGNRSLLSPSLPLPAQSRCALYSLKTSAARHVG